MEVSVEVSVERSIGYEKSVGSSESMLLASGVGVTVPSADCSGVGMGPGVPPRALVGAMRGIVP